EHEAVAALFGGESQVLEHLAQRDLVARLVHDDPHGVLGVVRAHHDDGVLEAGIAHPRHRHQQLALQAIAHGPDAPASPPRPPGGAGACAGRCAATSGATHGERTPTRASPALRPLDGRALATGAWACFVSVRRTSKYLAGGDIT